MERYEVLIVGGGPAGLAAALSTARMGIKTKIVDSGEARNAPSEHLNNFPTRDGIHPQKWRELAVEDLRKYDEVEFLQDRVLDITNTLDGFEILFEKSQAAMVNKIVLATGIKDQFPSIENIKPLWGKKVFHCPFCHGHELKAQQIGFLGSIDAALHMIPMLKRLSNEISYFTNGEEITSSVAFEKIKEKGVRIYEKKLLRLEATDKLHLCFGDSALAIDGLFMETKTPFSQSSHLVKSLGCELDENGLIQKNVYHETSVNGVYAAGDNSFPMHSVVNAIQAGSFAGAMIVKKICEEAWGG